MPIYMIDTIITSRVTYAVEADCVEHAMDEVTMINSGNEDDSFPAVAQKFLDESICNYHEVTLEEYHRLHQRYVNDPDEMTSYYWMGDELIRKVDYNR